MLRDLVARRLDQSGAFAEVRLIPTRDPVDYSLRGRLLSFEEVDYESGVKGRVAVELTLARSSDRKILWSGIRAAERSVQGKRVSAVVEALNAASDQVLDELLPALLAQVEQDIPQRAKTSP